MNHPAEEELVSAYYDGVPPRIRLHLDECSECGELYRQIREALAIASQSPIPERGKHYGAEVWARLSPHMPLHPSKRPWLKWWLMAPVAAALLAIVFTAGMLTEHSRNVAPALSANKSGERVLYLALSDHFEQAQTVLTEVAHAKPTASDPELARVRARGLITQNRLLRQRTARAGDAADAAVLEDLERVLLEVANTDTNLAALQQRMEDGNLLFRVRISSSDARVKGEKL